MRTVRAAQRRQVEVRGHEQKIHLDTRAEAGAQSCQWKTRRERELFHPGLQRRRDLHVDYMGRPPRAASGGSRSCKVMVTNTQDPGL